MSIMSFIVSRVALRALSIYSVHMDIARPEKVTTATAAVIKHLMKEKNRTTLQLSNSTGIARATLTRRQTGVTPYTVQELAYIAKELNTPVSVIMHQAEKLATAAQA